MTADAAARALLAAVRDGHDTTAHRILQRPDLPRVTLELARLAQPNQPLRPHGTHAAYNRHKTRHDTPCDDCVTGERAYQRERAARTRRRRAAEKWSQPVLLADVSVDRVAVERAVAGEPVTLTRPERREAVRVLHGRGWLPTQIGLRLRMSGRSVSAVLAVLADVEVAS